MVIYCYPREEVGCIPPVVSETTFATFLLTPRYECGSTTPNMPDAYPRPCGTVAYTFLVIPRGPTAEWIIYVLFDPLFLDCHAIGTDLPVDHDKLGFVRLNRPCGRSTSAWCQLVNRLRIVNSGGGQWKRLLSRLRGMLLMMMMTRKVAICVKYGQWCSVLPLHLLALTSCEFHS